MLFDPSNPEAFWLDVTNAGLGVLCLVCLLAIGWGVVRELAYRFRRRSIRSVSDPHTLQHAALGMTMADGGEPRAESTEESARRHAARK